MARLRILYLVLSIIHGLIAAAFWVIPSRTLSLLGAGAAVVSEPGFLIAPSSALLCALSGSAFALMCVVALVGFFQPGQLTVRLWMIVSKTANVGACGWFFFRHSPYTVFLIWGIAELLIVLLLFSMGDSKKVSAK